MSGLDEKGLEAAIKAHNDAYWTNEGAHNSMTASIRAYLSAVGQKAGTVEVNRDWTEDFSDENGNYQCRCIRCDNPFVGHKRRVICKACAGMFPNPDGEWVRTDVIAALIVERDEANEAFVKICEALGLQASKHAHLDAARLRSGLSAAHNRVVEIEGDNERLRVAADHIAPYLRWTVSDESPGHHPTMPSAVGAFHCAFDIETSEKRIARHIATSRASVAAAIRSSATKEKADV